MTIIVPFFDYIGRAVMCDNHIATLKHYTDMGFRVVTIEAVRPGTSPGIVFEHALHEHMVVTAPDVLLIQDNLYNVCARSIDDDCYLFNDSGCLISESAVRQAQTCLTSDTDILQPWDHVTYCKRDGGVEFTRDGAYYLSCKHGRVANVATGGILGLSAEYFNRIGGVFDRLPYCGCDTVLYNGIFTGRLPASVAYPESLSYITGLRPARVSYLPGECRHLWHMTDSNRRYSDTNGWLRYSGFNPSMLDYTDEGVLYWGDAKGRERYGKVLEERILGRT